MDRGAWWATVHGFAKSQTWLNDWHFQFHFISLIVKRYQLKYQLKWIASCKIISIRKNKCTTCQALFKDFRYISYMDLMYINNSGGWRRTGKPGVLQSMGSQRIRQDWETEKQQQYVLTLHNKVTSKIDCYYNLTEGKPRQRNISQLPKLPRPVSSRAGILPSNFRGHVLNNCRYSILLYFVA